MRLLFFLFFILLSYFECFIFSYFYFFFCFLILRDESFTSKPLFLTLNDECYQFFIFIEDSMNCLIFAVYSIRYFKLRKSFLAFVQGLFFKFKQNAIWVDLSKIIGIKIISVCQCLKIIKMRFF